MQFDKTELDNLIHGRVEPHIYAFTTNTVPNYLKVGDTYRPVSKRLEEWRAHFPELKQEFEGVALVDETTYFRDLSVHQFLEDNKHKVRLQKTDIPESVYYSKEFFKETGVADVQEAIADIVKDYTEQTQRYAFYNAVEHLPEKVKFKRTETYAPRPNQAITIEKFKQAIANGRTNLLMYAVMRFGKSFTSMCCATEMGANLVVVVSAKADVANEWKKTVESHVRFADYEYLTTNDLRTENIISDTLANGKKVVVFLTLQDLQGKLIKDRHQQIFGREIDLLLIDETHFGARAEKYGEVLKDKTFEKDVASKKDSDDFVDIEDAEKQIKTLNARIRIHLSGTPYRILMGGEFKKEDIIAFYQFTDIADDQAAWDKEHVLDDNYKEWDNPYYGFPQMVRFAFNPNESSRKRLEELKKNGTTYAFSALFKPQSIKKSDDGTHKKFIYEQEILDLLQVIDGSKDDDQLLGFLNYDKLKDGKMCRHMVIVLPYCASCDALEELIKINADKFQNLNGYEILNISGVGDTNTYRSTESIKTTISRFESEGKKTITLTVNRMLTGSTVPEWDTMLYLKDTASPQEYDQAVFRLQNQYIRIHKDENGNEIKFNMKPQTLLVDFDPSRMFVMQEQKAQIYNVNVDDSGNSKLQDRLIKELKVSPIVMMNRDKIVQVQATDIMQAVSDYKRDKGIKDEALEVPVDLSILDIAEVKAVIEKENEIGSKAGLSVTAHQGEDGGDEIDTGDDKGGGEDDVDHDNGDNGSGNSDNQGDDKKKEEISLTKKIQSYYTRILLFAYITKDSVISLSEIIAKMDSEDNKRIAKNLGLQKSVLTILEQKYNKWSLRKLDYKIQDINGLSHATDLTPTERANTAVKKFGKLGDAIVITPSNICKDMVDLFPDEFIKQVGQNGGRILDIAGTAGEFAVALYNKMTVLGIAEDVVKNSIYTIPKSPICYELTRKLYDMLGLNIQNIARQFVATDLLNVKTGDEIDYDKITSLLSQDKPFAEITLNDEIKKGDNMIKFDAVVGNPPYQSESNDDRTTSRDKPIYHNFVNISRKMKPSFVSMIIQARWMASGLGLTEFRESMLSDTQIRKLTDFPISHEVFENVEVKGGICYFLWQKDSNGLCEVTSVRNGQKTTAVNRDLNEYDMFVRNSQGLEILHKVLDKNEPSIIDMLSVDKEFGWTSNYSGFHNEQHNGDIPFYYNRKGKRLMAWIERSKVLKSQNLIDCWKVMIPEAGSDGGQKIPDPVIGSCFVTPSPSVCTQTYLFIYTDTEKKAENISKYVKTKLFRFLISLRKITQHATKSTYTWIPQQDFEGNTSIDWSKSIPEIDAQLYAKYSLSPDEISFIESMIKPMQE